MLSGFQPPIDLLLTSPPVRLQWDYTRVKVEEAPEKAALARLQAAGLMGSGNLTARLGDLERQEKAEVVETPTMVRCVIHSAVHIVVLSTRGSCSCGAPIGCGPRPTRPPAARLIAAPALLLHLLAAGPHHGAEQPAAAHGLQRRRSGARRLSREPVLVHSLS